MITTERLQLIPESAAIWIIKDHNGTTLGQLGYLHGMFSVELIESAKNLGIATEAACAWLSTATGKNISAINPQEEKSLSFLERLGFVNHNKQMHWCGDLPAPHYQQLNHSLGINTAKLTTPYHPSASQLTDCGPDIFNRPARLTPEAAPAWHNMQQAAEDSGVALQLVSAYRSPKYQAGLIVKKLNNGQQLEDILCVNTAPGHSEHHTGRAIDLTTPGHDVLEESFDQSQAFEWLTQNAQQFNFQLSYPKNNTQGIIYEPWHWCYQPG